MIRKNVFLICLVFFASCASIPQQNSSGTKHVDQQQVLDATPQVVEEKLLDLQNIRSKIKDFRFRLARGGLIQIHKLKSKKFQG